MILELQRFLLTAQEGNITKTAEKIFITQSALTQSIQRLEKELHVKLFHHYGKQIELTEEGKSVVMIGTKIMNLWNTAKNPTNLKVEKNLYNIGMFDNAALRLSHFLQQKIISESYQLELTIDSSTKLLTALKFGVLDAAVCVLSNKSPLPKNITVLETFTEKLFPVSSKKFSGKLHEIPFIFFNKGSYTREHTDAVFAERNSTPRVFAESTSTSFMKELALLGNGVALLPKNFVESELKSGKLILQRLPIQCERRFGILINEERSAKKDEPFIKELVTALSRFK